MRHLKFTRLLRRNNWTLWHGVGAIVLVSAGVLVCRDAWRDIWHIASRDEEASHIFLVPIVAAWLVWVRRWRLQSCQPVPSMIGPALIVLGWATHFLGFYYNIQSAWHLGAIIVAVGCLASALGKPALLRFLPAFMVLAFLVPVPGTIRQQIAIPLQNATAAITQSIFELLGQPIGRSGNQLLINGQPVDVKEACNGLRMVFALVLVSYAFAFGSPLRPMARFLILVASPISAIVCNIIRLIPTVWVFGYAEPKFAENFHEFCGWLMLPVAFFMLLGVVRILRWATVRVGQFTLIYD